MNRQSGLASFKAILAIVAFMALVFLGIKLVPPYVNNYQFTEDLESIARLATYAQGATEENIRLDVLSKAKDLEIELRPDQVAVTKTTYGVNIAVDYNVRVPVPGHVFNLKFNPTAGNKMLTAK